MNRADHKLNRLHAVGRSLTPEMGLERVRRVRNFMGRKACVPTNVFGLYKRDLEILCLLRLRPGVNSGELFHEVQFCVRPITLARRLVVLQFQGLIRERHVRGVRRWYLAESGFEAVQMLPL